MHADTHNTPIHLGISPRLRIKVRFTHPCAVSAAPIFCGSLAEKQASGERGVTDSGSSNQTSNQTCRKSSRFHPPPTAVVMYNIHCNGHLRGSVWRNFFSLNMGAYMCVLHSEPSLPRQDNGKMKNGRTYSSSTALCESARFGRTRNHVGCDFCIFSALFALSDSVHGKQQQHDCLLPPTPYHLRHTPPAPVTAAVFPCLRCRCPLAGMAECGTDLTVVGLGEGEELMSCVRIITTLVSITVTSAWFSWRKIKTLSLFFSHWLA